MLEVVFKSRFRKDLKKLKSSNREEERLFAVVELLAERKPLPESARDHALIGDYKGHRECHLSPDWLLVFQATETELILVRTGSHSELFGK